MVELMAAVEDVAVTEVIVQADLSFSAEWPVTGMGITGVKRISGDSQACGGICQLNLEGGEEVARRLLYVHKQGDLTLFNLLLINGRLHEWDSLDATGAEQRAGGAVLIFDGSALFQDVIFQANMALTIGSTWGGAVAMLKSAGTARFERCTFFQNSAGEGGAVMLKGERERTNYAVFVNCTFSENNAGDEGGGALSVGYKSEALLTNCVFKKNQAELGESNAVMIKLGGVVNMWECRFEDSGVKPVHLDSYGELQIYPYDVSIFSTSTGSITGEFVLPPPSPPSLPPPPVPLILPATNAPTILPPPSPPAPLSKDSGGIDVVMFVGISAVITAVVITVGVLCYCKSRRKKKGMHVTAHAQKTYGVPLSSQMATAYPPPTVPPRVSYDANNLFTSAESLHQRQSTFASLAPAPQEFSSSRLDPLPEKPELQGHGDPAPGSRHIEREARDELRSLASPWGAHQAYAGRTASDIAQDLDYWNHLAAGRQGANSAGGEANLAYLSGPWGPGNADQSPGMLVPPAHLPPPLPPPPSQQKMGAINETDTWSDLAQRGDITGRHPVHLEQSPAQTPSADLLVGDDEGDDML
eukprot:CAMPEP_0196584634 /NCGR_PEP_ID=MMETSP1081-20130531/47857_1 /TAXON_ID=36882 /ORGANISM="Pyramimonas amylifera, Strain CCMP720" /LENGTH=584 /DNA_ID=CAMNT_0041905913 /DNA_START=239 /DNA_END=1993 /DNA_ORIENTATION=+